MQFGYQSFYKDSRSCGEIGYTEVLNVKKPYGAEVVRLHSFLKNEVAEKEYVLLSSQLSKHYNHDIEKLEGSWISANTMHFENGEEKFRYFSLSPLFDKVKEPVKSKPPVRLPNPYIDSILINRDKELVLQLLLDFDMRQLWNRDAKQIDYDHDSINHIGTRHQCVLNDNSVIDFETFSDDLGEGKLVYGERILNIKIVRSASVFFILENEGMGTRLTLELHIVPFPVIGSILKSMMIRKMAKGLREQLTNIKEVNEHLLGNHFPKTKVIG